ncbi:uncharacterized protein LOC142223612 [Haematobia irritans]|uniref:uncharacterized protein LOC142223612 n=1 Tax=Haematobia irritans TaxID=7368 RepID=UPI003F506B32
MDTTNKKCIKKTNPNQFRLLVDAMEEHPELATSSPVFGKSKAEIDAKWDKVALKSNAAGPPLRNGPEWKKIWADIKCRTKAKIAENTKQLKGTGGGPPCSTPLTELEQDIDRICHLSAAAAPRGKIFGTFDNADDIQYLEESPPSRKNKHFTSTPSASF